MNKKILMTLLGVVMCLLAQAQPPAASTGKRYYTTLNKGFEAYYLHHDLKKAEQHFAAAFKIKEPDGYSAARIAAIYFKERQYVPFLKYRELGILLGDPINYNIDTLSAAYNVINSVPYYKVFQQKKDSLRAVFKAHMDLEFTKVIYRLLGADQLPRSDPNYFHQHVITDGTAANKLLGYADSINYFDLKDYITQHGAPRMNALEYETMAYFNLFYFHIVAEVDSAWGKGFLTRYFREQYDLGNLPNDFIPSKIDRDVGGRGSGEQAFGFFTKLDKEGTETYDAIQNLAQIDSLRTAYDLPILAVDALMRGLKLPEGYKINDRYTLLGR